MNDWLPLIVWLGVGIPLGVLTGKFLSGHSEEARGWTFFMMVLWPGILPLLALIGVMIGLSKIADWLGIENAQSDNRGV